MTQPVCAFLCPHVELVELLLVGAPESPLSSLPRPRHKRPSPTPAPHPPVGLTRPLDPLPPAPTHRPYSRPHPAPPHRPSPRTPQRDAAQNAGGRFGRSMDSRNRGGRGGYFSGPAAARREPSVKVRG